MRVPGDTYGSLDPGEAILRLGRAALFVPASVSALQAEHVVIAWKDVREARRAVHDALPLLHEAARVTIAEICEPGDEERVRERLRDALTIWNGIASRAVPGHPPPRRIRRCSVDYSCPGGGCRPARLRRVWTQPFGRMGFRRRDARSACKLSHLLPHVALMLDSRAPRPRGGVLDQPIHVRLVVHRNRGFVAGQDHRASHPSSKEQNDCKRDDKPDHRGGDQ